MTQRRLYDELKENRISTLDLNSILAAIGIEIPQRTLQYHLDHDMLTCTDDRIASVAKALIKNRKEFIKSYGI